jgi:hypothetical protein
MPPRIYLGTPQRGGKYARRFTQLSHGQKGIARGRIVGLHNLGIVGIDRTLDNDVCRGGRYPLNFPRVYEICRLFPDSEFWINGDKDLGTCQIYCLFESKRR